MIAELINETSWSWKQYVKRTHKIGVNLNDFATKLTATSRWQRNLITKSFTEHKNDSWGTWQTVNELTSLKSNTTDLANAFNEHFPQLTPKLANEISSTATGHNSCLEYLNITDQKITDQKFCFTPTNCSQVFSLLNKLSKSKAPVSIRYLQD